MTEPIFVDGQNWYEIVYPDRDVCESCKIVRMVDEKNWWISEDSCVACGACMFWDCPERNPHAGDGK